MRSGSRWWWWLKLRQCGVEVSKIARRGVEVEAPTRCACGAAKHVPTRAASITNALPSPLNTLKLLY